MFTVRQGPHLHTTETTSRIMARVLLALLPTVIAGFVLFGITSLYVIVFSVIGALLGEWVVEKIRNKPITLYDLSAAVTGVLLGCSLPSTMPLWMCVLGGFFATAVVKQLFGGIGQNFANPAITARIFLMVSFAKAMTTWTLPGVDGIASATPLMGEEATYMQLFLGQHGGCIGEVSALALMIGGVYLIVTRVINGLVPLAFIGSVFLFTWLFGGDPVFAVLTGSVMIAAFFMVTDYSTTPSTVLGKVVFAIGAGLISVLIRTYGNYPEGVSFAILLMNILTPQIEQITRSRKAGGGV